MTDRPEVETRPGYDEALAAAHREDDEQYATGTGKGAGPEEILAVVYPIIAAAVRAQIRDEILADIRDDDDDGCAWGLEKAARIAAGPGSV